MKIEPTSATLGAYITGIDLARLDDGAFRSVRDAWHEYAVLIFPGQYLSDDEHVAFALRFGRLEHGLKRSSRRGGPGRFSNVLADGTLADPDSLQVRFQAGNMQWHSDSSYKRIGAKASILAAHRVPGEGGETEWADMRAACEALEPATRDWLSHRAAVHSYLFSHTWHGGQELLNARELDALPPVEHALIKTHPATGRRSLFVGRHASHIVGEDIDDGRRLLRELTTSACQPPRTHRHRWQPGDIVIWDNRCVLHRGRPWPLDQARVMARSTVAGDDPDNEWAIA